MFVLSRILNTRGLVAALAAAVLSGPIVSAGDRDSAATPADKSRYNLFNPTPDNLLRELETDRPDETEAPTTVDAGHFQLEMDFANYTHDRTNGIETNVWNVAPFNLRIGLLNNVELSLIFDNYVHADVDDHPAHRSETLDGVGDFTTRLKINLWGNDGGPTAFALFPFIKFPTNTGGIGNNSVEGGAIFPLAVRLPNKFDMCLETGAGAFRNEPGHDYHAELVNSVTVNRQLVGKLSAFVEFFSSVSTEHDSDWIGTVDFGFTYLLTENIQLDCGCNVGVTGAAEDVHPFSGLSVRF